MIVTEEERSRALATNSAVLHQLHRRAKALAQRAGGESAPLRVGASGGLSNSARVRAAGKPDPLNRSYVFMEGRPVRGLPAAAGVTSAAPASTAWASSSSGMTSTEQNEPDRGKARGRQPDLSMGLRRAGGATTNEAHTRGARPGGRAARPLSPPQKLAQRLEREVNPLDFLGGGLRDGEQKKQPLKHRSLRVAGSQQERGGGSRGAEAGRDAAATVGVQRAAAGLVAAAPASSSACDVALMLLEKMGRRDLERVVAEAGRRLCALERK